MTGRLVSIIIPAFNAERWIARTIESAVAQTYREIEVVVVDDGSTDATAAIVSRLAESDARIRIVSQPNGGVARARNHGIDAARGDFVAPLDSDDIWAPAKIARQVAALGAAGPGAALAYGWFRRIDAEDRVLPVSPYPLIEGRVFHRHLDWNFISNGSTPLIRTEVARAVRYDPALHDAGNQGCEDYLFQLRIAREHDFTCVPAFLTGYRQAGGSMSAGVGRMIRSHLQMYALLYPDADRDARHVIDRRVATLQVELARNAARAGHAAQGLKALVGAVRHSPVAAGGAVLTELRRAIPRDTPSEGGGIGADFGDWAADMPDGIWATRRSPVWLAHLARLDAR